MVLVNFLFVLCKHASFNIKYLNLNQNNNNKRVIFVNTFLKLSIFHSRGSNKHELSMILQKLQRLRKKDRNAVYILRIYQCNENKNIVDIGRKFF